MNDANPNGPRRLPRPQDLHLFLTVVETGSMTKAAERLAVSRPVVSRGIADLEALLGVPLLDRLRRGVEPTKFGTALRDRGLAALDALRAAVEEIDALRDPSAGELRVASTEVWAAGLVPVAIEHLRRRQPRLRVRLEQGTATDQFNLLRDRICDVVVSRLLTAEPEAGIEMRALFHEPLVVVGGSGCVWARRKRLTLADIRDADWILSPLEVARDSPFTQAFQAAGLAPPEPVVLTNSLNLRQRLLETGPYVTLVPGSALHFGLRQPHLVPLSVTLPRWHLPTGYFILRGRALSPAAAAFIESLTIVAKSFATTGIQPADAPASAACSPPSSPSWPPPRSPSR